MMTAFGTVETAVEAMKAGAADYITKPIELDELRILVDRISERRILVKENEIRLPVLYNKNVDKKYELQGVPTLYIIDSRGYIRYEHKGYRPDIGKIMSIELEELLQG